MTSSSPDWEAAFDWRRRVLPPSLFQDHRARFLEIMVTLSKEDRSRVLAFAFAHTIDGRVSLTDYYAFARAAYSVLRADGRLPLPPWQEPPDP